ARTRALNENLPHRQRGNGEEMRAVREWPRLLGGQADKRFVDERGRLQGLPRPLASDVAGGDATKLVVDERHQGNGVGGHFSRTVCARVFEAEDCPLKMTSDPISSASFDGDLSNDDVLHRAIAIASLRPPDLAHDLHAVDDFAEYGVA